MGKRKKPAKKTRDKIRAKDRRGVKNPSPTEGMLSRYEDDAMIEAEERNAPQRPSVVQGPKRPQPQETSGDIGVVQKSIDKSKSEVEAVKALKGRVSPALYKELLAAAKRSDAGVRKKAHDVGAAVAGDTVVGIEYPGPMENPNPPVMTENPEQPQGGYTPPAPQMSQEDIERFQILESLGVRGRKMDILRAQMAMSQMPQQQSMEVTE